MSYARTGIISPAEAAAIEAADDLLAAAGLPTYTDALETAQALADANEDLRNAARLLLRVPVPRK